MEGVHMQEKVSLKQIIESVLGYIDTENFTDKQYNEYENNLERNTRKLYRKFETLIMKSGSDKTAVKQGGKHYEFYESEIPFMKVLLAQIQSGQGIIAEFINDSNKKFSSSDVHKLIQSLIDEADKTGMNEDEQKEMAYFLCNIFLESPLRSIEKCHELIDTLVFCLQDLTSSQQAVYWQRIECILESECSLRSIESIINIRDIAEIVMAEGKDDSIPAYDGFPPEIAFEYLQRDKCILERIQEDNDLRQYIEKIFLPERLE